MSSHGVAIIGAGMIGAAHAFGYRNNIPRFTEKLPGLRLATVCDANATLAGTMASTYGFERVAKDWKAVLVDESIGIISVCLPNFLHADVTEAAIRTGKHVICEKPLAVKAADARALYKLSKNAPTCSATVFNYRRYPAVTEVRNLIRGGEIGDPVHLLIQYNRNTRRIRHCPIAGATNAVEQAQVHCSTSAPTPSTQRVSCAVTSKKSRAQ